MTNLRNIVALAAAILPLCAGAQQKDTTIVVGQRRVVISGIDAQPSVKIYNQDGTELDKVSETNFVDGQEVEKVYVTSPFIPSALSKKRRPLANNYPTLFFGYNVLGGSALSLGGSDNLPTRDAKSWEWGVTLTSVGFRLQGSLALTSSIAVGQVFNHFKGNTVLATNNGQTLFETRTDMEHVKKSYMMYDFVRIPLMVEWQKRFGLNAFVAFGPSLELRWHERSRYVVGKDKQTQATDINMNPVGLGLDLRAGYGMVMLYARTSLTPLLKSALAPKCYPVSIGLGLRL